MIQKQSHRCLPFARNRFDNVRAAGSALLLFTVTALAHAQGTMDFSGATTLMGTFKTFAIYAGSVICFGGLIFAGIRMMSGRFQDAIPAYSVLCSALAYLAGARAGLVHSPGRPSPNPCL